MILNGLLHVCHAIEIARDLKCLIHACIANRYVASYISADYNLHLGINLLRGAKKQCYYNSDLLLNWKRIREYPCISVQRKSSAYDSLIVIANLWYG